MAIPATSGKERRDLLIATAKLHGRRLRAKLGGGAGILQNVANGSKR